MASQEQIFLQTLMQRKIISQKQASACITIFKQRQTNTNQPPNILSILLESGYIDSKTLNYFMQTQQQQAFSKIRQIGKYKIIREISGGGMGVVYEACEQTTQKKYALKLMTVAGAQSLKRFHREGKALLALNHPNIVGFKDMGEQNKIPYLVMDLVTGKTLGAYASGQRFPYKAAMALVKQLCVALDYAHSHKIIHRDLKPENIIINADYQPVIMDFGLVKIIESREYLTRTGTIMGTPKYMSPEQARADGKIEITSDIYSLGTIFYELLAAIPAVGIHKNPSDILKAVIYNTPKPICDLPQQVNDILLKSLQKEPDKRYQSAKEFCTAIDNFLGNISLKKELKSFCSMNLTNKIMRQKILPSVEKQRPAIKLAHTKNPAKIEEGSLFGQYKILKELGRGGMGVVYKALDTKLQRVVALKILLQKQHISDKQIKRFIQEARATASLKHPNIVEVYEVGEAPQNYFTMEFIAGNSLAGIIQNSDVSLSTQKIALITQKCAQALEVAHINKIIHRDIKPSNIMMSGDEPKIMDFGLAKVVHDNQGLSKDGDLLGTPVYMSPEQADNKTVTAKSDIYSLGVTLYEALTKRALFQGESYFRILAQVFHEDPVSPRKLNPDVPVDLEAICLKCLEKKAANRYHNALALAKDLENFLANKPITAKPITKWIKFNKWVMRNRLITLLSSIFSLFILGAVVALLLKNIELTNSQEQIEKANEELKQSQLKIENKNLELKQSQLKIEKANKELKEKTKLSEQLRKIAEQKLYNSQIALAYSFYQQKNSSEMRKYLDSARRKKNPWEWKLLNALQADPSIKLTSSSAGKIIDSCFTPDDRYLICAQAWENEGQFVVWDLASKKLSTLHKNYR